MDAGAFPFVSRRDIELMQPLRDQLGGFNGSDRTRIGDWAILPLCCGWAAGRNLNRAGLMIELIQPRRDALLAALDSLPPVIVAMQFGSWLEEWCRSESFVTLAAQRLRSMGRLTDEDIQRNVPYFTLAIFLNCLDPENEDTRSYQEWIGENDSSWTELFFAVGILNPADLRLERVAKVLLSFQKEPVRGQFRALLQRYEGIAQAPA